MREEWMLNWCMVTTGDIGRNPGRLRKALRAHLFTVEEGLVIVFGEKTSEDVLKLSDETSKLRAQSKKAAEHHISLGSLEPLKYRSLLWIRPNGFVVYDTTGYKLLSFSRTALSGIEEKPSLVQES